MKVDSSRSIIILLIIVLGLSTTTVAKLTNFKKQSDTAINPPDSAPVVIPKEETKNEINLIIEENSIEADEEEIVVKEPVTEVSIVVPNHEPVVKGVIIDSKFISDERAIEIALKKMGNKAELKNIKAELENNPPKYELKIMKNKFEYNLEIHAKTGAILDSKKQKVE